jgi:hypothetical protein
VIPSSASDGRPGPGITSGYTAGAGVAITPWRAVSPRRDKVVNLGIAGVGWQVLLSGMDGAEVWTVCGMMSWRKVRSSKLEAMSGFI